MTGLRIIALAAACLLAAGCTEGQRASLGAALGAVSAIKASQCAKPPELRRAEWEATGRRITPLDCDGDGRPDFGVTGR